MQNDLGQWLVSLKHYTSMCLLASSPERLPVLPQAIVFNLLAYFLIGVFAISDDYSYPQIVVSILLQTLLLGLIAYIGLHWKKLLPRFVQTFSALTGVTLLIDAVAILLVFVLIGDPQAQASSALTIKLANLFWNLAALSLIFKRAFEITHLASAMISFNFFAFYLVITNWLLH